MIYALLHPDTEEIRYIGQTINTLTRRLSQHISDAKRNQSVYKSNWINSLSGVPPKILPLEIDPPEGLDLAEIRWIAKGRSEGWRLTNNGDGGHSRKGY